MKIKESCLSVIEPLFRDLSIGTVYRTKDGHIRLKVVFPSFASHTYCVDPLNGNAYRQDTEPGQFVVKEVFPQATLVLKD